MKRRIGWLACLAGALVASGCSTLPAPVPTTGTGSGTVPEIDRPLGERIAALALLQRGKPYLYGGHGPEAFDCSGLVRYTHAAFGVETPRTTLGQFSAARPVALSDLKPGDLLFFRIDGASVSHVGIYSGEGRFVHAPQTGRVVETRALEDAWFRPRLLGAGRLVPDSAPGTTYNAFAHQLPANQAHSTEQR